MENIFSINSHKSSESVFILDTSHTKKKSAVAVAIVKRKQEFIIFAFNFPKRISKKGKENFNIEGELLKGCWDVGWMMIMMMITSSSKRGENFQISVKKF